MRNARRPLLIAGGGVLYGLAGAALAAFAEKHGVPVAETQGGKGALAWDHPLQLGAIGVTGSPAANELARDADLVLAVGTRLQDFTTGSHSMFGGAKLVNLNVNVFDALKWRGVDAGRRRRARASMRCRSRLRTGSPSRRGKPRRKRRRTPGATRSSASPAAATPRCRTKAK